MADGEFSEPIFGEAAPEETALINELEDLVEAAYAEREIVLRASGAIVETVEQAAALAGVPVERFIVRAAFLQAVAELRARKIGAETGPTSGSTGQVKSFVELLAERKEAQKAARS